MLCSFLLYSRENQLYIYTFPLFFRFSFHRSLQSIEQRSLCYTVGSYQWSVYIEQRVYVSPNLPVYPSPTCSPLVTISLFSISVTQLLFCKQVHLYQHVIYAATSPTFFFLIYKYISEIFPYQTTDTSLYSCTVGNFMTGSL